MEATILDAIHSPALWAPWFRPPMADWQPWFVFLKALFGLEMDADDRAIFLRFTGRSAPSLSGYIEAAIIVGRRGGKSLLMATIAVFLAVFRDWSRYLVLGESALVQSSLVTENKRGSRGGRKGQRTGCVSHR